MNATLDTAPAGYAPSAPVGIGRAHAKAILFGEHAVVYGSPALAIPVPTLTTTVHARSAPEVSVDSELYTGPAAGAPERIAPVLTAISSTLHQLHTPGRSAAGAHVRISSDIPPDRGLGSSAAVAAALAQAIAKAHGRDLDADARFEIVQEAERRAHGNPSGLDARTVLAPGPIQFHRGHVTPLPIAVGLTFVLADSGVPGSTATAVAGVRAMHDTDLGTTARLIDALARTAASGRHALAAGDLPGLGALMSEAHENLRALGVSLPALNNLVATAHAHGALGAKLTGGGLGGCVLALVPTEEAGARLSEALRHAGAHGVWQVNVPPSTHS